MPELNTVDLVEATVDLYDRNADRYAAGYRNFTPTGEVTDLVAWTADGLPHGAPVADIGSGCGRDLAALRDADLNAVGVDASAGLARHASVHGPVTIADVRDLPFGDASFDAVLCAAVLLHLPDADMRVALGELRRVLRPGGRLVMSVKQGDGPRLDSDGRFFRFYRDDELDLTLDGAGFEVTAATTDGDTTRPDQVWLNRAALRR